MDALIFFAGVGARAAAPAKRRVKSFILPVRVTGAKARGDASVEIATNL